MVRGFTPIIGLAVVMALALAAVFGSMSLANPAMAAIGQPADAELTERTVSPQDASIEVNVGATENVNIADLITGGGANFESATATAVPTTIATVGAVTTGFNSVNVPVTGVAAGPARVSVRVVLKEGNPETLRIDVTVVAATPASAKGEIPEMNVVVGDGTDAGAEVTFDATEYFEAGMGTGGAITTYAIASSDDTAVTAAIITDATADDGGEVTLTATASTGDVGDFALVTITASDTNTDEDDPTQSFFVTVVSATEEVGEKPTVEPAGMDPGENTKYTVKFMAADDMRTGVDEVTVEFKDFSVPSSIDADTVTVSVTGMYDGDGRSCETVDTDAGGCRASRTFTNDAASVSVDGEKLIIDLKVRSDDFVDVIKKGVTVTIVIGQAAGISNPTEAKGYDEVEVNGVAAEDVEINLKLSLSEDDGGRGDTITVTGKGFKNGTTMTAYRLASEEAGFTGSQSLCSGTVGSDDVGKCEFTVTSPLFKSGDNFINVKDGRNQSVDDPKAFELKASISVSPEGASVGDSVQVQMYDFISGSSVQGVRIARQYLCMKSGMPVKLMTSCSDGEGYSNWTPGGSASALGELSFNVSIPDGSPQGRQELRVETAGENDSTNIVISGPVITTTPSTVLANQRVSLTGTGFTSGSEVDVITFAGEIIPKANIQGGQDVSVDNGGNWSASVVLPMTNSTTSAGTHAIKVRDTMGRGGQVMVTVPERKVTITPDTGRVGSIALVRGENFPSKNDDGEAFSISIEYSASNGKTTSTTVPDASGRFEQQITVPTTANIPSTNSVTVSFTTAAGTKVPLLVNHNVPEGAIDLSTTSGGPGSTVDITGEGFKAFVPVSSVKVGPIEVTPAPRPSTDAQGMMAFTITVPGLDVGIQTIEVMVGGTTASTGFTVVESGIKPGDIKPVAEAVEPLGGNLVVVFHFNNDTKSWSFYSTDPAAAEANSLIHMITGETYLLQIKSNQEVILNRDTRSLTCVGGNCWNQLVW